MLFLSFSDPDLPDVAALIEEAETQILERRNTPVHFTLEYFNPSWLNGNPSHNKRLVKFLREKYPGQAFDLVITIDEQATTFAESTGSLLFPNTPVVFCTVNPQESAKSPPSRSGRTGVIRKLDYLPTLQAALEQNPGTRQVIVVSGSSEFEKLELTVAREQFASHEPNIEFHYWTDIKLSELKARLANVEPNSVILFLNFLADVDGEQFVPSRILPAIAQTANQPMYGTLTSFVGNGVTGGSVVDLREVGRILGQEGGRILNGEKAETIPVQTGEFQHNAFDWRELHRWGIPDSRLPTGSAVLYWEASPWEVYRWKILGLGSAVIIEALLIILLLHLRSRRRRAEETLRRKESELSEAQRLARIGSWQWDPKTDSLTWSQAFYGIVGLDPALPAPLFKQLSEFFTPESWKRLNDSMNAALQTGETYELELEAHRKDGSSLWVIIRGEAVRNSRGQITRLRGTMQNITERRQAEEARLKHTAIVESSDDAIISENLQGIITSWNYAAQHIFGFTEAEAVGQPINIIIPPELEDEENTILRRVTAGERIEHYETIRGSKEAKRIYVSLTISPVKDSIGRIVGVSKIARDITQKKQAEEELRKSEEKFFKVFRQGPMSVALTNLKTHRYIDVNETFERLTGYSREELIGRSALEVGLWADPSERVKLAKKLSAEGILRDEEFRFVTKDGQARIAQASAELIEVEGEVCALAAMIDITDRKKAEEARLESEMRFRLMADSAPVLMWIAGTDKLCTDFNKEWLKFTGRTIEQELGGGWAQGVHPDDLPGCLQKYTHAFDNRQTFAIECRLRRRDGEYRWLLDHGVPRFLEDGSFAGYIGCCIDITDQKEAKAALANLSGRLLQAQEEERARIARELHDDINQRLALLANGLQEFEHAVRLHEGPEEEQQLRTFWQMTGEIASDIQHLSHQLHPSKLQYLGLAPAVREMCQEFSKLHKIEIDCMVRDVPRDLDENASLSLYRTVQESLHNIAKHSHAHHVKVELVGRDNIVRLLVSDDGVGFDPAEAKNVHGLGVISMKERLRSVGGKFSIWSRPSLGTQVEATIPVTEQHAKSAEVA